MIMFGGGTRLPGDPAPAGRGFPGPAPAAPAAARAASRSAGHRPADRRRLGLRLAEPGERAGRQRRRPDQRDHRPGQPRPASPAGRLGRAAGVGVGRLARARLPRDGSHRRCEEGRDRRRLALRQGGAGHDGVRSALRGGPGRIVGRRRRQAPSPQLGRSGREPHRQRRIPLDGRQLPQVRRGRGDLRQQDRRRPSRSTRTS